MLTLFKLLKSYKTLASVLALLSVLVGSMYLWGEVKKDLISQGYQTAITEYQAKMLEQHSENISDTETKLILLRENLQTQYKKNLERVYSEVEVDSRVITNTKFIEKEVYIEKNCNTVDPNLISMFNETINGINASK